jgi:hypothetical protein
MRGRRLIGQGYLPSQWSRDGRALYVSILMDNPAGLAYSTAALSTGTEDMPLTSGPVLPVPQDTPIVSVAEEQLAAGSDRSVYSCVKIQQRWNIYRILLH